MNIIGSQYQIYFSLSKLNYVCKNGKKVKEETTVVICQMNVLKYN